MRHPRGGGHRPHPAEPRGGRVTADLAGGLATLRETRPNVKLLDARSREEHEAVAIPGSRLITQDLVQEIFNSWSKTDPLVIYDHHGDRSLDAAAYFIGHGFSETKCLAGGIDAWSVEIDPSLPRYKVELLSGIDS